MSYAVGSVEIRKLELGAGDEVLSTPVGEKPLVTSRPVGGYAAHEGGMPPVSDRGDGILSFRDAWLPIPALPMYPVALAGSVDVVGVGGSP